ncbi:MAG: ATP-dependent RNA helicase HrpA [Burkholderiales bacterium]|nr:ATP-dependent RNA helicase HrpA [Burkholderiales bacterium]
MSARQRPEPPLRRPLPPLRFPEALPVSARRDEIAAAIRRHPVVIVCGETGSGKTTQLPKICALAGRGRAGLIGHTQPRRLAATAVARRIAEELGSAPGVHVGHKIRFAETFSPGATIKLMTDGILLAETLSDPLLSQYDTLIIDEAHERSLNIDFLLGYLKQLLEGPRRDDLKLVITSATIDAERFARHFGRCRDDGGGGAGGGGDGGDSDSDGGGRIEPAPVIEVSGRLYPVEIRYQGFDDRHRDDDDESDLPSRIDEAIETLWREAPGDVLVFLPGEREIRDVADHLRRLHARESASRTGSPWSRGPVEILPLYSRLSAAEQQRVFAGSHGRRIVLATNVAETSLTVPGIRYVVDSGLARVKRYRYRGKVEQLQVEPVSQAAANQRAGRCGRVADGVCIRLYDEADFARRPRFTDPEILRSSLAAVILRMKALRLVEVERFPFIDPPPRKAIADGYALLHELGAVDAERTLTGIGRQLSLLPVDPRIGRMLLAAHRLGCLREVTVIAAALSAQDPRERPLEAQQAADQWHRRFADERSDFLAWVKLWDYWTQAQRDRTSNGESNRALAQRLEREFLSVRRLREWADVHAQLLEAVRSLKWRIDETPAPFERIHRALLTGLLGNLGFRMPEEAQYAGTHETKFVIHPGSALVKKAPRWLMAAEMVDTGRLYARTVARIEPEWIEEAAAHLIRRSWSDPAWSRSAGRVVTQERGVLYGLTVYAQRRVDFEPVDPVLAREVMIREALVGGDWDTRLPFFAHNRRLVREIEALEERIRRPDLLVDDRDLRDWYDARIPADVCSGQALERWWREAARADPKLLFLSRDALLRRGDDAVGAEAFPRRLTMRGAQFDLDYRFDPGAGDDGVTLTVPLAMLNQVDAARCEWLVPGMLRDKVQALVKSLPPRLRRHVVPLPEYAEAFVARWHGREAARGLLDALIDDLREHKGVRAAPADFRLETLAPHLAMNFRVVDVHGAVLGSSRQLAALRAEHGARAQGALQAAFAALGAQADARTDAPEGVQAPDGAQVRAGRQAQAGARPLARTAAPAGPESAAGDAAQAGDARLPALGERYTAWTFGTLPELMESTQRVGGRVQTVIGYPALVDRGDAAELQLFDDPARAARESRKGLARLFAIALREPLKFFARQIPDFQRMSLLYASFGSADDLREALTAALIERTCLVDPLPADAGSFAARMEEARPRLNLVGQELARTVGEVLAEQAAVVRRLGAARAHPEAAADIEAQLAGLLPRGFIGSTPAAQLKHLPRYLKAIGLRLDKLRSEPARDAQRQAELAPLLRAWRQLAAQRRGQADARLEEVRWLIEELRVSLFAQTLRTAMPVSAKRVQKALDGLRG